MIHLHRHSEDESLYRMHHRGRNLKEGHGKLMAEVADTIDHLRSSLGTQGAEIVPVVLIYRQKTQSKRSPASFLPLLPPPFNLLRS